MCVGYIVPSAVVATVMYAPSYASEGLIQTFELRAEHWVLNDVSRAFARQASWLTGRVAMDEIEVFVRQ